MKLTRRDAAAALAALGAGGAAVAVGRSKEDGRWPTDTIDEAAIRETMVAAAEVVYPSAVTGIEPFVETFLDSRLNGGDHAAGIADAVGVVDDRGQSWYDGRFATLTAANRNALLDWLGVDTAAEQPDGTAAERVRYYIVNELLLALYASPTGGELVGIENPQGHGGGIDSYQRGPQS